MKSSSVSYKCRRIPLQIIAHSVWLYVRFNLFQREDQEMLMQGGADISYEAVRSWVRKFGPSVARNMRQRSNHLGDVWHLDEVAVRSSGQKLWHRRVFDQHGVALDEILRPKGAKRAQTNVASTDKASWFPFQSDHHVQAAITSRRQTRDRARLGSLVTQEP